MLILTLISQGARTYKKDSGSRARGHALLIPDRPNCVTILSIGQSSHTHTHTHTHTHIISQLCSITSCDVHVYCCMCSYSIYGVYMYVVRDAASRLPDGEGTRVDVSPIHCAHYHHTHFSSISYVVVCCGKRLTVHS